MHALPSWIGLERGPGDIITFSIYIIFFTYPDFPRKVSTMKAVRKREGGL
jgi:hypothetical protein